MGEHSSDIPKEIDETIRLRYHRKETPCNCEFWEERMERRDTSCCFPWGYLESVRGCINIILYIDNNCPQIHRASTL